MEDTGAKPELELLRRTWRWNATRSAAGPFFAMGMGMIAGRATAFRYPEARGLAYVLSAIMLSLMVVFFWARYKEQRLMAQHEALLGGNRLKSWLPKN